MIDTFLLYEDWKDFFKKKLLDSGHFYLSNTYLIGDTDIEIYSALKGNPGTIIEVGYFSSMTIIYVNIFNPETPGNNRQQEVEHLYKYQFDSEKQYGPPGLEFNEINIQGISNYLNEGFNGIETVYYRNNKPVKSRLTTSYYPDSPGFTVTHNFYRDPFHLRILKKILLVEEKYDEIRKIDLKNIFSGLKDS